MDKDLVSLYKYLKDNDIVLEANHLNLVIKKYSLDANDLYSVLPNALLDATKYLRDIVASPLNIMLDELSALCLSLSAAYNEKTGITREFEKFITKLENLITSAIEGVGFLEKYKILEQGASEDYRIARQRVRALKEQMSVLDTMTGEMSYNYKERASDFCENVRRAADIALAQTDPEEWYKYNKKLFNLIIEEVEFIFR